MTYGSNSDPNQNYGAPRSGIGRYTTQFFGCVLLALGVGFVVLLGSYSPYDANWFAATGNPPENMLGAVGASIAGVLILSIGWASWLVPVLLLAWGLRFLLLRGNETAFARLIAVPFLLFFGAAFAGLHTPPELWPHDFGLGGLAGDATLGLMFTYMPIDLQASLVMLSLGVGTITVLLLMIATGITIRETGWFLGMSFWSLGSVLFFLRRPFGRSSGEGAKPAAKREPSPAKNKRERKRVKADSARILRKVQKDEPKISAEAEDDPFAARIDINEALAEPPKIDIANASRELAEQKKLTANDRVTAKIENATRAFKKPAAKKTEPTAPIRKAFGFMKPKAEKKEDAPVETDSAAAPAEPTDLETRLKSRINQALEERVAQEEAALEAERQAEEEARLAEEARIEAERQAEEEARLEAEAQLRREQEPEEDSFEEDEATIYPVDPEPEEPEKPQRRGLFGRGENLFSGFGGRSQADADVIQDEPPLSAEPRVAAPAKPSIVEHPKPKKSAPSKKAMKEAQPELFDEASGTFELPALNLLTAPVKIDRASLSDDALAENARMLETVLDDYGVKGDIVSVRPGPVVTMYELEPAPGLKASRVIGLADDIARSMSALAARVSTVPGRTVIGIELPNEQRETVYLREILSGRDYGDGKHALPLALGKDIGGLSIVADLAKMPHLLIAGTTGSGKSVAINTMILSLLYKLSPDECRLIMIDPKMLELSVYEGIPHLLSPVVTDPKKAVVALKWVVGEMEERYRKMSKMGVRNIAGYNSRVQDALDKGEDFERTVQTGFDDATGDPVFETETFKPEKLPYIVVVVDEMADLMMVAGKEIEACIQRLAQMARASGIHLIMATQRPSVDVITGTIKANFPTRISFQVTSKVDSRTILGEMGAEQLLGMGDMLYMAGGGKITRVHGPFASDEEVEEVVNHLRAFGPPVYVNSVQDGPETEKESQINEVLGLGGNTGKEDALYDEAVAIVARDRKASTSYIQRRLSIGYNKAARLVEQMEENGVVSPANHVGKREVLVPEQ